MSTSGCTAGPVRAVQRAAEGPRIPAQQRPDLAVVCTAGLLDAHDLDDESGVDLDDLGDDHSLTQDPTVQRLRAAVAALGEDAWFAVRLPGTYEGEDDLDDGAAIDRWSTVAAHPDELGWLSEALHHRAETDDPDDPDDPDDELELL